MINQTLLDFLCEETPWEDLGNEKLLHELPEFGESVGNAINTGTLLAFTIELSGLLEKMDLYKASLLSTLIGFACEKEQDTSAGRGIIALFARSCKKVYELFARPEDEEEELPDSRQEMFEQNPDQARAYEGFNILCVSTMAFLTRDAALRSYLAEFAIENEITYLSEETDDSPYLRSIHYVNQMLAMCSDYPLLVLHPQKKTGFLAMANDVSNCFHLLFLLEEQIYQTLGAAYGMQEFQASESLTRLAHGEYPQDCWDQSYTTHFIEYNYGTAFEKTFSNQMVNYLIWGEMPPAAIPQLDGRAVIVLFENGPSRSFSAQFLAVPHEALHPYVTIERELTEAEYLDWMQKIQKRIAD